MRNERAEEEEGDNYDEESSSSDESSVIENSNSNDAFDDIEDIGDLTRFAAQYVKNRDKAGNLEALERAIERSSSSPMRSNDDDRDDMSARSVSAVSSPPPSSKKTTIFSSLSSKSPSTFRGIFGGSGADDNDHDDQSISSVKSAPVFGAMFPPRRDDIDARSVQQEPDAAAGPVFQKKSGIFLTKPSLPTFSISMKTTGGDGGASSWTSFKMNVPKPKSPFPSSFSVGGTSSGSSSSATVQNMKDFFAGVKGSTTKTGAPATKEEVTSTKIEPFSMNLFGSSYSKKNKRELIKNSLPMRPSMSTTRDKIKSVGIGNISSKYKSVGQQNNENRENEDDEEGTVTFYTTQSASSKVQQHDPQGDESYKMQNGKFIPVTSKPKEGRYKLQGGKLVAVSQSDFHFGEQQGVGGKKRSKNVKYSKASKTASENGTSPSTGLTQSDLLVNAALRKYELSH